MIVILSYFNTKIGPKIFYSYPEIKLEESLQNRIFDIFSQQNNEESFTHYFRNLNINLINYYFQIPSKWARGKNEMIMLSISTDQPINLEIEERISLICTKFSEKMQSNEEIFTGLYINDLDKYTEVEKENIIKNELSIKKK